MYLVKFTPTELFSTCERRRAHARLSQAASSTQALSSDFAAFKIFICGPVPARASKITTIMSSKLSIRYSGKLIKLPITPSTPMHEVLRAACQQHGLGDSARFELQHGPAGRAVDLSLPFRLTGISNNATVNLAPSTGTSCAGASSAASVRVALQVAGEARREHALPSIYDTSRHPRPLLRPFRAQQPCW